MPPKGATTKKGPAKKPAAAASKKAPAAAAAKQEPTEDPNYKIPDPEVISAKQIIPVLVGDANKIYERKDSPAALVIDTEQGITARFLQYNETVIVIDGRALYKKVQVEPDTVKKRILSALAGCLRYGKVLLINISKDDEHDEEKDASEEAVYTKMEEMFEAVKPGLMEAVRSRAIVKDEDWHEVIRSQDDSEASNVTYFDTEVTARFHLVVLIKGEPTKKMARKLTLVKVE